MPLFRRRDADLVTDLSDVRRIMPFVMRTRNESIVLHSMQLDVGPARAWLREYNRTRGRTQRATLFHLFTYACARALHERPGLNRFVSGGRIYQRREVSISFAAKKRLVEDSPLVTLKLKFPANETFDDCVKRIVDAVEAGRVRGDTALDRELGVLLRLPAPVLRAAITAGRWLDRWNVLPATFREPDPLFCSLFLTNDGSVGVSNAFHHLYEYGTCSLFAVLGSVEKTVVANRRRGTEVADVLDIGWSVDERISDGLYSARSLLTVKRLVENPARYIDGVDTGEAARESTVSPGEPQS